MCEEPASEHWVNGPILRARITTCRPDLRLALDDARGSGARLVELQGSVTSMPWFPDFVGAVELARSQTRAAGRADPVGQYLTALSDGDPQAHDR